MSIVFPDWLESAIEAQNADALRQHLIKHWDGLKLDFFPALNELNPIEKRQVMECVLYPGVHWQEDATEHQRDGLARINAIRKHVAELSMDLVANLNFIKSLEDEYDISAMLPNLWELIEKVAEHEPAYSEWLNAMKTFGHWDDFFNTTSQGRYGPRIADVLLELSNEITCDSDNAYSVIGKALSSRKSTADQLRVLLVQLKDNLAYPLRMHFTLPDKAIAAIATALFDFDPPVTADAVKTRRHQLASEDR